ncbi:hypothetical protein JNW90_10565 [Micromonospora sp. STR1s_5]|nr:hypothetical protein [Micromonospora sp. STR1s_5]
MATTPQQDQVLELDPSFYDMADQSTTNHDFDQWWSQRQAARDTTPILGIQVPIPSQVPAEIMLHPETALELGEDDSQEMIRLLVQMIQLTGLKGQATLDDWVKRGLGSEQLVIVFTWFLINGMRPPGKPAVSFERIAALVEDRDAGKAAAQQPTNRAGRRAAERRTAATPRKAAPAKKATAGRRSSGTGSK